VLIVPTVALPPRMLFTDQVTPVFELPVTMAVNWAVSPGKTVVD
jgi:hypothetical protein